MLAITKAQYAFIDNLVNATASNPSPQSTDAAKTEKQAQMTQDMTVAQKAAGTKSSKKVSSSSVLLYFVKVMMWMTVAPS